MGWKSRWAACGTVYFVRDCGRAAPMQAPYPRAPMQAPYPSVRLTSVVGDSLIACTCICPVHIRYIYSYTQVVRDLRTLRELASYLLRYDAVTFLAFLEGLRQSEGSRSVWLFHDAAHAIFDQVRYTFFVPVFCFTSMFRGCFGGGWWGVLALLLLLLSSW